MKFSPDLRQSFEHFACLLILPLVVLLSACGGSNNNDELSDTPSYLPSVSITSSTNMVQQFDDLTLSWTAAQADSCVASGDWSGDKTTTGTETLSPATAGTKDYTLTCEGAVEYLFWKNSSDFLLLAHSLLLIDPELPVAADFAFNFSCLISSLCFC